MHDASPRTTANTYYTAKQAAIRTLLSRLKRRTAPYNRIPRANYGAGRRHAGLRYVRIICYPHGSTPPSIGIKRTYAILVRSTQEIGRRMKFVPGTYNNVLHEIKGTILVYIPLIYVEHSLNSHNTNNNKVNEKLSLA